MTGIIRRWKRHLSEERLFDCYVAERSGEGIDPPAAEHLADCRECHRQYGELVRFMDEMWIAADTETSAIFTPDRLHVQQQEIARRLELVGHSGRVLTFRSGADSPERVARLDKGPRHLTPTISRVAAGWIAAAAAAGLFIGVGAGMLYDGRSQGATPAGTVMSQPAVSPQPVQADTPAEPQDDDDSTFFLELEAALDRPRTPELMALDAMTPRARDISYRIR
jgi:hypothetical protein